jgi:protein phosphatase 1L
MLTAILGWRSVRSSGRHFALLNPKIVNRTTPLGSISASYPQTDDVISSGRSSPATTPSASRPTFVSRRSFFWRVDQDQKFKEITELRGGAAAESQATTAAAAGSTTLDAATKDPSPNKTPSTSQQQLNNPSAYQASVCTAQGFRSYMEDEFFLSLDADFAGVFDGHGGKAVSRYLRQNLYANLQASLPVLALSPPPLPSALHNKMATTTADKKDDQEFQQQQQATKRVVRAPTVEDYEKAMRAALYKVDREVQRISHWSYQGSTAVAVWIHEEKASEEQSEDGEQHQPTTRRTVLAANVGDSRAVLCRNDTAWDLTRDHKPDDPGEQERIENLGGKVVWCGDTDKFGEPILEQGIYRVNGNLALSRAIGDRSERPHVTAEPEIITAEVGADDQFILLASDGLWDVMSSHGAVEYVLSLLEGGQSRDKVATLMVEEALRRGTYDNITVVIIWLDRSHHQESI